MQAKYVFWYSTKEKEICLKNLEEKLSVLILMKDSRSVLSVIPSWEMAKDNLADCYLCLFADVRTTCMRC